MSAMPEKELSRMEQYVMKCIWDSGEALTPNEIRIRLRDDYQKEYAYPTINTYLRSIMKKGYVDQNRDTYNYRYSARISEEDYRKREISQLRTWYGGSVSKLTAFILKSQELTNKEMEEIRNLLDEEEG